VVAIGNCTATRDIAVISRCVGHCALGRIGHHDDNRLCRTVARNLGRRRHWYRLDTLQVWQNDNRRANRELCVTAEAETIMDADVASEGTRFRATVSHRRLWHTDGECRSNSGRTGSVGTVPRQSRREVACSEKARYGNCQNPVLTHVHPTLQPRHKTPAARRYRPGFDHRRHCPPASPAASTSRPQPRPAGMPPAVVNKRASIYPP
jgi:hypothetical protein